MTVEKSLSTTRIALELEERLKLYVLNKGLIPSVADGLSFREYANRLEELGFRHAADYYRGAWGPIYQRRAEKFKGL